MAFVLSGDPATLALEGPYAGAELDVLTDVPLGISAGIGLWMTRYAEAEAGSAEEATALQSAWTLFAGGVLVGWNLHDRRGVVPADASAFSRISPRFIVQVLGLWADLMTPEVPGGE
mgnify:CR=1 FL=1